MFPREPRFVSTARTIYLSIYVVKILWSGADSLAALTLLVLPSTSDSVLPAILKINRTVRLLAVVVCGLQHGRERPDRKLFIKSNHGDFHAQVLLQSCNYLQSHE